MMLIPFLLAAGSLPSLIAAAPIPPSADSTEALPSLHSRAYNILGGSGKITDGWPSMDHWFSSFDEMFELNKAAMKESCAQWNVPNNSDEEIENIAAAIQSVASETGVDARFILAIVMQESNGCVRAPTTDNGVVNPGLMQSHDGTASCNNGQVQTPCPASQIKQMIVDGTAGTAAGDGLKQCLEQAGGDDVTAYYRAARIYNSGSIAASGNLGQGIATHCYVSDVANRLSGWSGGPSSCDSNTIGQLKTALTSDFAAANNNDDSGDTQSDQPTAAATSSSSTVTEAPVRTASAETSTTTSTTTSTITSTSTNTVTVTAMSEPSSSSTSTSSTSFSSIPAPSATHSHFSAEAPIYPYAASSCKEYYTVVSGDYCLKVEAEFGITAAQLLQWNSGLDEDCTNLWLGYQYCIKA